MELVDHVHAVIHTVICVHADRNVPSDGHAKLMRVGADSSHIVRLHRAIDFDLLKSGIVILGDPLLRVVRIVNAIDANRVGAVAVDDAGQQHVRPQRLAAVHGIPYLGDEVELIADVPHCGNSRSQVDRSPLHLLEVCVHIPQPGDDVLAGDVDALRAFWNLDAAARANGYDLTATGDDGRVRNRRLAGAIDEGCAYESEGAGAASGKRGAQLGEQRHLIMRCAGNKGRERRRVLLAHRFEMIELASVETSAARLLEPSIHRTSMPQINPCTV